MDSNRCLRLEDLFLKEFCVLKAFHMSAEDKNGFVLKKA